MSEYPKVTIITPSYNQAQFIDETIQSVLSQGYPNLEYGIVDGGSTDGSVDIIRRYADRLDWWVSERDKGQGEAINKGFSRATGEIVAWLNSDDVYLPGAIHAAVRALQEHPECGLVYGDVVSIDAEGTPFNVMTFEQWGLEDLMQFKIISQPAVFMRRSVLAQTGYLDLSYHYLLDHLLWLRMARLAPMHYVPERWAMARYHAAAKNVSKTGEYGKDAFRLVEWMAQQPEYAQEFRQHRRRILAGAQHLKAHYLLDGNQSWPALQSYLRSFFLHPPTVAKDWRRIGFAAASMFVNIDSLRARYLEQRKRSLSGFDEK